MDVELSQDFKHKLRHVFKNYVLNPEIEEEHNGLFKDFFDYLTTEDIEILVYAYCQKHRFDPKYDLTNIKLIDDHVDFSELKTYFKKHPLRSEGENHKLILKLKKGEPPLWGVHVVPVYIRHEGDKLSAFIHDAAFGIVYETKDGFSQATNVIEEYLRQQAHNLNLDYRIIKSSTITMGDPRNCPIYALLALRHFVKFGKTLFDALDPFLLPDGFSEHQKIQDQDNHKIFHLTVDGLPSALYKYTNRRTLKRINDMYNHEWMPVKTTLPEYYQAATTEDILATHLDASIGKPFGTSLGTSLGQKLALYEAPKQAKSTGQFFQYNHAADTRMNKARKTILQTLTLSGVVEEVAEESNLINQEALKVLATKIRKT
jgi:hypothetical protein